MRLRKYVRKSNAHTLLYGTSDMVIVYLVSCKAMIDLIRISSINLKNKRMNKLEYIPGDLVFANGKLCEVIGDSYLGSDFIKVSEYVHGSFDNNVYI